LDLVLEDVEAGGLGVDGKVVLVCEDGYKRRWARREVPFRIGRDT